MDSGASAPSARGAAFPPQRTLYRYRRRQYTTPNSLCRVRPRRQTEVLPRHQVVEQLINHLRWRARRRIDRTSRSLSTTSSLSDALAHPTFEKCGDFKVVSCDFRCEWLLGTAEATPRSSTGGYPGRRAAALLPLAITSSGTIRDDRPARAADAVRFYCGP